MSAYVNLHILFLFRPEREDYYKYEGKSLNLG